MFKILNQVFVFQNKATFVPKTLSQLLLREICLTIGRFAASAKMSPLAWKWWAPRQNGHLMQITFQFRVLFISC